jgi:hypothetical protein
LIPFIINKKDSPRKSRVLEIKGCPIQQDIVGYLC